MTDTRVDQYNRHVRTMIASNAALLYEGRPFGRKQEISLHSSMLDEHQPTNGEYGASCLGEHEEPVDWPCELVRYLQEPASRLDR
ncbi:hypothetical protein P9A14_02490 [Gordonia hongkongensis]|uniref:Uncharacterized protein n=1 Tax=Gordonia hongkongensis TaxID=1701090 RepID=A0AAX3T864_9ACTN|nr:hypothetical protein [Gordonia hongkongensis]QIK49654.1 hypothetical protein G8C36_22250 [Gordonia terrae]WFP25412.1 hypothetical protein P9A14_02490 [Gordonia hongkongensis]